MQVFGQNLGSATSIEGEDEVFNKISRRPPSKPLPAHVGSPNDPPFAPIVSATCRNGQMIVKVETLYNFGGVVHARDHRKPACSGYGENSRVTFLRINLLAEKGDEDYCGVFYTKVWQFNGFFILYFRYFNILIIVKKNTSVIWYKILQCVHWCRLFGGNNLCNLRSVTYTFSYPCHSIEQTILQFFQHFFFEILIQKLWLLQRIYDFSKVGVCIFFFQIAIMPIYLCSRLKCVQTILEQYLST